MRLALYFDGLSTIQLRNVLSAFAGVARDHSDDVGGLSQTSDAPVGVVVGCDGPEKFNARVPPLRGDGLTAFVRRCTVLA